MDAGNVDAAMQSTAQSCGQRSGDDAVCRVRRHVRDGGLCPDAEELPCEHKVAAALLNSQHHGRCDGPRSTTEALEYCRLGSGVKCSCMLARQSSEDRCDALAMVISLANSWSSRCMTVPPTYAWNGARASVVRDQLSDRSGLEILQALGLSPGNECMPTCGSTRLPLICPSISQATSDASDTTTMFGHPVWQDEEPGDYTSMMDELDDVGPLETIDLAELARCAGAACGEEATLSMEEGCMILQELGGG